MSDNPATLKCLSDLAHSDYPTRWRRERGVREAGGGAHRRGSSSSSWAVRHGRSSRAARPLPCRAIAPWSSPPASAGAGQLELPARTGPAAGWGAGGGGELQGEGAEEVRCRGGMGRRPSEGLSGRVACAVGDHLFCNGDVLPVRETNQRMQSSFCIRLLEYEGLTAHVTHA